MEIIVSKAPFASEIPHEPKKNKEENTQNEAEKKFVLKLTKTKEVCN